MSNAMSKIADAGFKFDLWVPEFGWKADEVEAKEPPFDAQLLAAYQCFQYFFAPFFEAQRMWVHLAAEMQSGKTGVVAALIRLVLSNALKLMITPDRIFLITGMNDEAWKKQTRARLPSQVREGVQHSKGLHKVEAALTKLAAGEILSNVLIILDESHIAAAGFNEPNKQIYQALKRLCPIEQWAARNIRIITISATDPVKVIAIGTSELPCEVVRLQTDANYQSVQSLHAAGRISFIDGDLHNEPAAITALKRAVIKTEEGQPLYHIVRPRQRQHEVVKAKLETAFPDCVVIPWDAETAKTSKAARKVASAASDGASSATDLEDINDILKVAPSKTTFILLKNMFYAAKTMNDEYVGVLHDRISAKEDTALQSLLGRACGYGKSARTHVFAQKQAVENYFAHWKELCSNPKAPRIVAIPVSKIANKMTGIVASRQGGATTVGTASSVATPYAAASGSGGGGGGGGSSDSGSDGTPAREKANEDNFSSDWKEFVSFELAKAWGKGIHKCKESEEKPGFLNSSTSKRPTVLRYDEVMVMKGGKKTANLPWNKLKVGDFTHRCYVGYKDMSDPASAVFIVRRLTRNI